MAARGEAGSGAVAQLGERLLCKQEAVGSIPSSSTQQSGVSRQNGRRDGHLGSDCGPLTSETYRLRQAAFKRGDCAAVIRVESCSSLTIREGKAHSELMRF